MARKIIAHVATSADGYIARPDGDVKWLDRPRPAGNYGMGAFYRSIDTVLMGRKTYEVALGFGQRSYSGKKNYVFSRKRRHGSVPEVEFVQGPIAPFARRLRAVKGGRDVWLVGGADLIGAFLDAQQLDELSIHVVPVLIGEGIPMRDPRHCQIPLRLLETKAFTDGVVRLRYEVVSRRRA